MPSYQYFIWNKWLFRQVYYLSNWNHNNKFIRKKTTRLLRLWDWFFVFLPILYIVQSAFPSLLLFAELIKIPPFDTLHQYYHYNSVYFSVISFTAFFCSRIYISGMHTIENEELLSENFHTVNHAYRNFIDRLMLIKKNKGIYLDSLTDEDETLRHEYGDFINGRCRRAQRVMSQIINDEECYISLKWLEEINPNTYRLIHHKSFPDEHGIKHVNGVTLNVSKGRQPGNLFEVIMERFRNKSVSEMSTYKFGVIENYVWQADNFDLTFESFNKKIKSTIVIPITINASLSGFFCFNSYKIGALREKHMHILAGFADNIANLARCITLLSI